MPRQITAPPQAIINEIRNLLGGYGDSDSLLKELMQNAEDARATYFDVVYFKQPADGVFVHPLLNGPALCILNNGDFRHKDLEAMFSIGLGTRAADANAIGRFGKGMKSLFSLCEAFFILANDHVIQNWGTNMPDLPDDDRNGIWLMNPYTGLRHQDWDDGFIQNQIQIKKNIGSYVQQVDWNQAGKEQWQIALWIPLRKASHLNDNGVNINPLHVWGGNNASHPGDNGTFYNDFSKSFSKTPRKIPLLRNLKRFYFCSDVAEHNRVCYYYNDDNPVLEINQTDKLVPIHNSVLKDNNPINPILHYRGFVGRSDDNFFLTIRQQNDWPKSYDAVGNDLPIQAEPHWGCICSLHEPTDLVKNSLSIDWAVFFPVVEQLDSTDPNPLELSPMLWQGRHFQLYLHGYFFLDDKRIYIYGLERENKFNPQNLEGANTVKNEWNSRLAKECMLPNIPKALDLFSRETLPNLFNNDGTNDERVRNLIEAIKKSNLWRHFQTEICSHHRWVYAATGDNQNSWELVPLERQIIYIPTFRILNQQNLWSLFPALASIAYNKTIVHEEGEEGKQTGLFLDGQVQDLTSDILLQLINGEKGQNGFNLIDENKEDFLNWLSGLKEKHGDLFNADVKASLSKVLLRFFIGENGQNKVNLDTVENKEHFLNWLSGLKQNHPDLFNEDVKASLSKLPLVKTLSRNSQGGIEWITPTDARTMCNQNTPTLVYCQDANFVGDIRNALPQYSFSTYEGSHAELLEFTPANLGNVGVLTKVIIAQPSLSLNVNHRLTLFNRIIQFQLDLTNAFVKNALRYLMHGSANHKNEGTAL